MSTALTKTNGAAADYVPAPQSRYDDPGVLQTIKETVCKGATDSQFRMFIEICKTTGLNPFLKEIWFVSGVGIMAARDGYLRVANDHPMFDGMETRVERDAEGIPIKAVCTVWRKDRSHPIICEAYYNEYKKASSVWQTYKSAMISKVSEVLALKRSFAINGVVTEEEIGPQSPAEDAKTKRATAQEAANRVAAEKIERMKAGEQYKDLGISESDAAFGPETAQLEDQLQASVDKVSADKFKALAAFRELKAEIIKTTGDDVLYYRALGAEGYEKSNLVPAVKMREVYRKVAKELANWKAEDGIDKELGI